MRSNIQDRVRDISKHPEVRQKQFAGRRIFNEHLATI